MKTYFKNVEHLGSLKIEHIFYNYREPVLFVCVDPEANRYLCSCCKLSEEWVIAQITEDELIDVIDNKTPLADVFFKSTKLTAYFIWDGATLHQHFGKIPSDMAPVPGAYLDLPDEETKQYRDMLSEQSKIKKSMTSFANMFRHVDFCTTIKLFHSITSLTSPLREMSKFLLETKINYPTELYHAAYTKLPEIDIDQIIRAEIEYKLFIPLLQELESAFDERPAKTFTIKSEVSEQEPDKTSNKEQKASLKDPILLAA